MQSTTVIQFGDNEASIKELDKKVKSIWSASGNLQKDIKSLRMYIKADEKMVYYVINDTFNGSFPLYA